MSEHEKRQEVKMEKQKLDGLVMAIAWTSMSRPAASGSESPPPGFRDGVFASSQRKLDLH